MGPPCPSAPPPKHATPAGRTWQYKPFSGQTWPGRSEQQPGLELRWSAG